MQKAIPCVIMRGGSSRGPYLLADDLPKEAARRDQVLLALMGSPHALQVDGIGGSQPQTSKVAIVSRSTRPGADVDYLFAQVSVDQASVDTKPNCGNMLAGVGPFAIEAGLITATVGQTVVRIFNVNTGARIDALVETPKGRVTYAGDTAIPGVNGTAAPIRLTFRDFIGGKTGKLFPSGHASDVIDGVTVTLCDSAMPMMLVDGRDFGFDVMPAPEALEARTDVLARIEAMRLEGGKRMGFGDVSKSVVPKVGLLWPGQKEHLAISYLMPWRVHKSVAVTGAIGLATAARAEGTVAHRLARPVGSQIGIEHASGLMELELDISAAPIAGATVVRTARRLFEGRAFVPAEHYQ
jgi:2-methylaconitate cis-trans-isomerase PrpF